MRRHAFMHQHGLFLSITWSFGVSHCTCISVGVLLVSLSLGQCNTLFQQTVHCIRNPTKTSRRGAVDCLQAAFSVTCTTTLHRKHCELLLFLGALRGLGTGRLLVHRRGGSWLGVVLLYSYEFLMILAVLFVTTPIGGDSRFWVCIQIAFERWRI